MELVKQQNAVVTADPASMAAAEAAKQRIQSALIIAMNRPRNQDTARTAILKECSRPSFAEKAQYSKPVGNRKIVGPTIRFAEVALRCWGNVSSQSNVVYEDNKMRRVQVTVTDLETNNYYSKEFNLSKTVERKDKRGREVLSERTNSYGDRVYVVVATEDELQNKEASQVSKSIRNEGLRLIPGDIIEDCLIRANETIRKGITDDPDRAKKNVIDAFSTVGVKPLELEKFLGHSLDQIVPDEIANLRIIFRSINDGESRWNEHLALATKSESESPAVESIGKPVDLEKAPETEDALPNIKKTLADRLKGV